MPTDEGHGRPLTRAESRAKIEELMTARANPDDPLMVPKPAIGPTLDYLAELNREAERVTAAREAGFEPFNDFVLVEPLDEGQTAGGLYLPDDLKDRPKKARVLAWGPGRLDFHNVRRPVNVRRGQVVLHLRRAGVVVDVGPKRFLLLLETELIGGEPPKPDPRSAVPGDRGPRVKETSHVQEPTREEVDAEGPARAETEAERRYRKERGG